MTGERYYYQTHLKDYAQENRRHPTPEENSCGMAFSDPIPDNFGDRSLSVAISSISTAAAQSW